MQFLPFILDDYVLFFADSPMGFIERCMMSVVLVRVGTVWGSGVILDRSEGIIVTCYHVVKNAKRNKGLYCV